MARSLRSSRFTGNAALLAMIAASAFATTVARAQPAPAAPPAQPAPPDLPPPPPPPWTGNPNALPPPAAPATPEPAPGPGPAPASSGISGPPAPPPVDIDHEGQQERRLAEMELRMRQIEERHRRSHEEQDEWWGWTRHVRISGYLQPQGLWQWSNNAASPNNGVVAGTSGIPSGIGSNDVVAKADPNLSNVPLTTNQDYFRIRRARLKIELEPNEYSRMVFEIDPNLAGGVDSATGTIARNVEAQGIAKWAEGVETTFGMGIFKIPYGWEVLQSDADRPFIERSGWKQNVPPGEFDTGAKAYPTAFDNCFTGQFAVINGVTEGEKTFALLPGQTQGKSMVGRINWNFGAVDIGTSGYYGQGSEVSLTSMAFKEFPREAWNLEAGLHHRFLELGQTRLLGEFNMGQNMDRGVKYAFGLPGLPTVAANIPGGSVTNRNEIGGFVRLEQDISRWSTLAFRWDYYSPDTSISNNARNTFGVVGVVHFTRQLQLMVEYNKFVDQIRPTTMPNTYPDKEGDLLSAVFQVRYP